MGFIQKIGAARIQQPVSGHMPLPKFYPYNIPKLHSIDSLVIILIISFSGFIQSTVQNQLE